MLYYIIVNYDDIFIISYSYILKITPLSKIWFDISLLKYTWYCIGILDSYNIVIHRSIMYNNANMSILNKLFCYYVSFKITAQQNIDLIFVALFYCIFMYSHNSDVILCVRIRNWLKSRHAQLRLILEKCIRTEVY